MSISVLVVDDHEIVRHGIVEILCREQDFQVVRGVNSATDAVQFVKRNHPDVVLMDIGLPGMSGIEATAEITRQHPECKVVVLSMYGDEQSVIGALKAGARGYLVKNSSDADLVNALRVVAKGGAHFSSYISDRLLSRIQKGDLDVARPHTAVDLLSPRVAQGKTSKEVAVALDLKEHTIRSYRKVMMKKLGVNNASSFTRLALSSGMVATLSA